MKSSYTLHDLPKSERPRERLAHLGSEALSAPELLALVLGRGVAGEPVMMTAQKLLSRFGSLEVLCAASIEDLQAVKGVGFAKACQLKAILEIARRMGQTSDTFGKKVKNSLLSPGDVFQILKPRIAHFKKEHFVLVTFDTRNKVIGIDTISVGTLNASLVHPREMFEIAIRRHAASVIIAHNHPSGDPDPSDEDIRVTAKLTEAGKLLGIQLLDHIIVGKDKFYSFSQSE
jgi:DNA repair protein RadC